MQKVENLPTAQVCTGMVVFSLLIAFQGLAMQADDLYIAKHSVPTINLETGEFAEKILNEFSPEIRAQNFDKSVNQKYPKATIINIASGVKHVKLTKYYSGKPVRINLVEIDRKLANDLTLMPVLSSSDTLKSRKTISNIAKSNNAIVALNGTFFKPQTGVPLGTLMIDKKIYTGPIYDRVALGIFDSGFDVARVQIDASISTEKVRVKIDNINQPRMLSTYVLAYTSDWGNKAPSSPKYGTQISVDKDGNIIAASANPLEIPKDGYVIVGPISQLKQFWGVEKVKIKITTMPEWKNVRHIISGGPYLIKDGEIFVDMTAQKLGAIGGRNPRSAIGYTADGNLILVAADGREGSSIGLTLMELASFMKSAGCTNAINLDGGGSTVMYVNGQIVNHPQVKGGIPLSNAIVLKKS